MWLKSVDVIAHATMAATAFMVVPGVVDVQERDLKGMTTPLMDEGILEARQRRWRE